MYILALSINSNCTLRFKMFKYRDTLGCPQTWELAPSWNLYNLRESVGCQLRKQLEYYGSKIQLFPYLEKLLRRPCRYNPRLFPRTPLCYFADPGSRSLRTSICPRATEGSNFESAGYRHIVLEVLYYISSLST